MNYSDGGQRTAPLLPTDDSPTSRWGRVRFGLRFLRAMDSKAFMSPHGRVVTPSAIGESTAVERSLSDLSKTLSKSAGNLLAPPDKETEEVEQETQTNGEAIVNLLNNCLGSGMLSMGYAFAKAGIIPTFFMMCLSAFLNRYTLLLNVQSNRLAGTDPASAALGETAFGSPGRIALIILYSVFGFLCCVSYVDAAADAACGLLELILGSTPSTVPVLIGCWAVLLLPTTLLRSLKAVALLSFVAFLGGIVMLAAVSAYCFQELLEKGFPPLDSLSWGPPSLAEFGQAFPILLLVFSIQAGGGVVLATMRDTSDENISTVSRNAYLLCVS